MSRRDLRWRLAGIPLFAAAGAAALGSNAALLHSLSGLSALLGVLAFLLYLGGAALVIQGERLPDAWSGRRAAQRTPLATRHIAKKRRPR